MVCEAEVGHGGQSNLFCFAVLFATKLINKLWIYNVTDGDYLSQTKEGTAQHCHRNFHAYGLSFSWTNDWLVLQSPLRFFKLHANSSEKKIHPVSLLLLSSHLVSWSVSGWCPSSVNSRMNDRWHSATIEFRWHAIYPSSCSNSHLPLRATIATKQILASLTDYSS